MVVPRKSGPQRANRTASAAAAARHARIAKAADYRAAQRGFEPGRELDDWLTAEADVERAIEPRRGKGPRLCGD